MVRAATVGTIWKYADSHVLLLLFLVFGISVLIGNDDLKVIEICESILRILVLYSSNLVLNNFPSPFSTITRVVTSRLSIPLSLSEAGSYLAPSDIFFFNSSINWYILF